ncbi:Eco57I restriction endonuclease [Candidatus Desulfosporosinus infrequens]|uniref:site-specific DNA-methyltransferase (adenine-specific) n=1 Tax=Candidatus Desulfosporosinus infrequens TaxID=2043169 RepID=A0A2U3KK86_9FIRM|nr:Eco57I restriction endonuclease [Candidatus Desulfosporosinus infrequens]
MDKTAIKNYAVAARRKLIDAVRQKAYQLYVREEMALAAEEAKSVLMNDGIFLTNEQFKSRERLISEISRRVDELGNEKGYNAVMEEIAYTWFNRIIALRFMEVNDYLPSGIRILSSVDEGRTEPDVIREADQLDYVDQGKIAEYRDLSSQKLYKYILTSQCNALSSILPGMFEKIDDYTELLLPDALYAKGGIVHDLVYGIDEENFHVKKTGQIEIVGWLYQYYISEKKDEVFAGLKKNIKLNKETIPAATQLFTPEWIVRYMVENSLGRLWLERDRAESGLSNEYMNASYYGWKYYVEEAEQEPKVTEQLRVLCSQNPIKCPEDIKLIDPCMGSGHILVYAFDLLYQIYFSQGYAEREIPNLILQNNMYGLDLDKRAAQLAYFALMMKARSYNRRFFRQENIPDAHVHAVIESDGAQRHHLEYMGQGMDEVERQQCRDDLSYLIELFSDAREYGSILKIGQTLDYVQLRRFTMDCHLGQLNIYTEGIDQTERILLEILSFAEIMTQKYDVVVTNPPYMGSSGMGAKLSEYVKKNYPDSKSDMFAVFIEKCGKMLNSAGFQAMITQQSWMFLSSYEKLRTKIVQRDIVNMAHLGARAFEEIGGEVVQTTVFVLRNISVAGYLTTYLRLVDYKSQSAKENAVLRGDNKYTAKKENFFKIPGMPIAYWASEQILHIISVADTLDKHATIRVGMHTGNNELFVREWYEIDNERFVRYCTSHEESKEVNGRWFPYNKGGGTRRWYGYKSKVVDWERGGEHIHLYHNLPENYNGAPVRAKGLQFKEGITWSDTGTSDVYASRYTPSGALFDVKGSSAFLDRNLLFYALGFLNVKIATHILNMLNPTVTYQVGNISSLPLIIENRYKNIVDDMVKSNVLISKTDWDSFETSWDFQQHPLLTHKGSTIVECYNNWETVTEGQFEKLKSNEEELNRIFIEIYGLQDELSPEVEDKDVTIRKADLQRDIRSFLSYAVGCMFGRYSLDELGLVFAGGEFDMAHYKTFLPENDNIIPIEASDYFDDDIVVRFVDFVRVVYGEDTLLENIDFIADALYPNGNGSSKEKIRRYFLNDFYKDHVKTYQKKPIYWLFDSGKQSGFKVLVYLHRYDKFIVARVRTDYLHPLQRKYESEIGRLEMLIGITENATEKAAYRKEIETLRKKIEECRVYDQVVAHIAHQAIELDLDDGVTVNYAKFQGVEVPKDHGKTIKMDLFGKI